MISLLIQTYGIADAKYRFNDRLQSAMQSDKMHRKAKKKHSWGTVFAERNYVPAFKLRAYSRERFVIKLPPETLEIVAVGKTVDGGLPRAIMDTSALIQGNN